MGPATFKTECNFDIVWPYKKPVFVLSNKLKEIPESHTGKAFLVKGALKEIIEDINKKGFYSLNIDEAKTIQSFLRDDLIDEMTITIIPYLLYDGIPLLSDLPKKLDFECDRSKIYLDKVVQNHFVRKK